MAYLQRLGVDRARAIDRERRRAEGEFEAHEVNEVYDATLDERDEPPVLEDPDPAPDMEVGPEPEGRRRAGRPPHRHRPVAMWKETVRALQTGALAEVAVVAFVVAFVLVVIYALTMRKPMRDALKRQPLDDAPEFFPETMPGHRPPSRRDHTPERDDAGETTPDPASPLRDPTKPTLPEAAVGEGTADRVIQGHTYDGIREYDNPMPGWWVALFWAGILFAPLYMLGLHVFGYIDSYGDDFAEAGEPAGADPRGVRLDRAGLQDRRGRAPRVRRRRRRWPSPGVVHFAAICAACHGQNGEGVIGPNLTDDYWLHGSAPTEVWTSIAEGFPEKGMPPMKDQLGEEERAEVMAYVYSLQGSSPPNPKDPQGELAPAAL